MFTIRHWILFLSVLPVPAATRALAQDSIPGVLATSDDERAIAKHRLTVDNVRKMFAVDRDLLALMRESPDVETRVTELVQRLDPQYLRSRLTIEARAYEQLPETARILQRHGISGREYVLTRQVAMGAEMRDDPRMDEMFEREFGHAEFPEGMRQEIMMPQPLKFWRAMDPALKAEAAEWKRVREEMERYGRDD